VKTLKAKYCVLMGTNDCDSHLCCLYCEKYPSPCEGCFNRKTKGRCSFSLTEAEYVWWRLSNEEEKEKERSKRYGKHEKEDSST